MVCFCGIFSYGKKQANTQESKQVMMPKIEDFNIKRWKKIYWKFVRSLGWFRKSAAGDKCRQRKGRTPKETDRKTEKEGTNRPNAVGYVQQHAFEHNGLKIYTFLLSSSKQPCKDYFAWRTGQQLILPNEDARKRPWSQSPGFFSMWMDGSGWMNEADAVCNKMVDAPYGRGSMIHFRRSFSVGSLEKSNERPELLIWLPHVLISCKMPCNAGSCGWKQEPCILTTLAIYQMLPARLFYLLLAWVVLHWEMFNLLSMVRAEWLETKECCFVDHAMDEQKEDWVLRRNAKANLDQTPRFASAHVEIEKKNDSDEGI